MNRRFELVFGGVVDISEWEAAADRLPLVERRFGPASEAESLMVLAAVEQILSDEPPQVWETVERLLAEGLDTDDVMDQLVMVFAQTVQESRHGGSFDHDCYRARLARLPLPDPAVIEQALLHATAAAVVVETDALVAQVAELLGSSGDDPLVVRLVEHIEEQLADEGGPLVRLPGGRTGHAARLSEDRRDR